MDFRNNDHMYCKNNTPLKSNSSSSFENMDNRGAIKKRSLRVHDDNVYPIKEYLEYINNKINQHDEKKTLLSDKEIKFLIEQLNEYSFEISNYEDCKLIKICLNKLKSFLASTKDDNMVPTLSQALNLINISEDVNMLKLLNPNEPKKVAVIFQNTPSSTFTDFDVNILSNNNFLTGTTDSGIDHSGSTPKDSQRAQANLLTSRKRNIGFEEFISPSLIKMKAKKCKTIKKNISDDFMVAKSNQIRKPLCDLNLNLNKNCPVDSKKIFVNETEVGTQSHVTNFFHPTNFSFSDVVTKEIYSETPFMLKENVILEDDQLSKASTDYGLEVSSKNVSQIFCEGEEEVCMKPNCQNEEAVWELYGTNQVAVCNEPCYQTEETVCTEQYSQNEDVVCTDRYIQNKETVCTERYSENDVVCVDRTKGFHTKNDKSVYTQGFSQNKEPVGKELHRQNEESLKINGKGFVGFDNDEHFLRKNSNSFYKNISAKTNVSESLTNLFPSSQEENDFIENILNQEYGNTNCNEKPRNLYQSCNEEANNFTDLTQDADCARNIFLNPEINVIKNDSDQISCHEEANNFTTLPQAKNIAEKTEKIITRKHFIENILNQESCQEKANNFATLTQDNAAAKISSLNAEKVSTEALIKSLEAKIKLINDTNDEKLEEIFPSAYKEVGLLINTVKEEFLEKLEELDRRQEQSTEVCEAKSTPKTINPFFYDPNNKDLIDIDDKDDLCQDFTKVCETEMDRLFYILEKTNTFAHTYVNEDIAVPNFEDIDFNAKF